MIASVINLKKTCPLCFPRKLIVKNIITMIPLSVILSGIYFCSMNSIIKICISGLIVIAYCLILHLYFIKDGIIYRTIAARISLRHNCWLIQIILFRIESRLNPCNGYFITYYWDYKYKFKETAYCIHMHVCTSFKLFSAWI